MPPYYPSTPTQQAYSYPPSPYYGAYPPYAPYGPQSYGQVPYPYPSAPQSAFNPKNIGQALCHEVVVGPVPLLAVDSFEALRIDGPGAFTSI